jgi:predicted  nucleic acid-binding Zn-ribbon protein
MSSLMTALEQLDAALDRLESAVEASVAKNSAERDRLSEELRNVRANHTALQSEARTVSTRLDAAIGRLNAMLEG